MLSGVNTYSGVTTIDGGKVKLGNAAGLGTTAGGTVAGIGTLDLNGQTVGAEPVTLSGLGADSTGALVNNSGTEASLSGAITLTGLSCIGGTGDTTLSGSIDGISDLSKAGVGIITLSGVNTYSGVTTIDGGTLKLGNAAGLGTTTGGTTVNTGFTLDLNGQTVGAEPVTLKGTGIGGKGALVNNSGTAASLSGAIILGASSSIGGTGDATLSGIIGGISTRSLTKVGANVITLSGVNTNLGATTISAGSIRLGNNEALGSVARGTLVSSGASVDLNGHTVGTEAFTISGVGTAGNGALVNKSETAAVLNGSVTLAAAATIGCTNPLSSFTINGSVTGTVALTKKGHGTVVLSGDNALSLTTAGSLITIGGGTLRVGHNNALGDHLAGTIVGSSYTLDLNGHTIGAEPLTISGNGGTYGGGGGAIVNSGATAANASGPITLAAHSIIKTTSGDITLDGVIDDGDSTFGVELTSGGSHTIALNKANTYGGVTTVSKGTLAGNGSVANSAVEIKSGARVSPGVSSVANFGTGTLSMDKGSMYDWQYSSTTADVLRTAGLTLPSDAASVTIAVTKTDETIVYPITRTLFTFSAGSAPSKDALKVDMTAVPGLQTPTVTVTADAVLITIVPEPTGLVCLGALALLLRRR